MAATPRMHRLMLLLGTSVLAACGGAGGGSGSTDDSSPGGGAITRSATLAWNAASGPVSGYRPFVSRNGGGYAPAPNVTSPSVRISGVSGDRVRIQVAAFDSKGDLGPLSPASPEIVFTDTGVMAAGATTAVAQASPTSSGSTRSAVPSSSSKTASTQTGSEETAALPPRGGESTSDLLWEEAAGGLRLTSLASGALRTDLAFARPSGWRIAGKDDFDGDGRDDLLWENGAGELAISTRAALAAGAPATPLAPLHALAATEMVIATGDLDGDGLADLVVQDDASGSRSVWLLNPGAAPDVAVLGAGSAQDSLAATGDFDGDSRMDLLFRSVDGALSIHFMAGAMSYGSLVLPAGAAPEALATGDFDGDGDDDLVRRDAAGLVTVLLMGERMPPHAWGTPVDAGAGWQVVGAGDFDGDLAADLVWMSASEAVVGFYAGAAAEYVAMEPGAGWTLVSFAP